MDDGFEMRHEELFGAVGGEKKKQENLGDIAAHSGVILGIQCVLTGRRGEKLNLVLTFS